MKALVTFVMVRAATFANAQNKNLKINPKDTAIYTISTANAIPPIFGTDGTDAGAFRRYLGTKNIQYVESDTIGHNFESRFIASFIVEKDGKVSHVKIIKPTWDSATGRLIIKTLQESPKWYPATRNDYAVRYQFLIPFSINAAFKE